MKKNRAIVSAVLLFNVQVQVLARFYETPDAVIIEGTLFIFLFFYFLDPIVRLPKWIGI